MIEDLHLERVPSNNTQLVSCHLKLKLHFFPAYNMKGAHILKESKHVKGQLRPPPVNKNCLFVFLSRKMITSKVRWDPPSVTKMSVCLSVMKNDHFQGRLGPPVSDEKCLSVCHQK